MVAVCLACVMLACGAHTYDASASATTTEKNESMSPASTRFKKMEELVRLGRLYSAGAVADEFRQSLPIPRRSPDGLRVDFFFCAAFARPGQPVVLGPPHFLIAVHADSGQLDYLRAVGPKDFGQSHGKDESIGTFGMQEGMRVEEFMDKRATLYATYDILLPAFARGGMAVVDDGVREAAREYKVLFRILSEPPLLPYYHALGQEFFTWVAHTGR
jgi:hypothetical protein